MDCNAPCLQIIFHSLPFKSSKKCTKLLAMPFFFTKNDICHPRRVSLTIEDITLDTLDRENNDSYKTFVVT